MCTSCVRHFVWSLAYPRVCSVCWALRMETPLLSASTGCCVFEACLDLGVLAAFHSCRNLWLCVECRILSESYESELFTLILHSTNISQGASESCPYAMNKKKKSGVRSAFYVQLLCLVGVQGRWDHIPNLRPSSQHGLSLSRLCVPPVLRYLTGT